LVPQWNELGDAPDVALDDQLDGIAAFAWCGPSRVKATGTLRAQRFALCVLLGARGSWPELAIIASDRVRLQHDQTLAHKRDAGIENNGAESGVGARHVRATYPFELDASARADSMLRSEATGSWTRASNVR
jgi:hypothetical protein